MKILAILTQKLWLTSGDMEFFDIFVLSNCSLQVYREKWLVNNLPCLVLMTNGWLDGGWTSNPAFVQSLFKQWAIIPRFCRFYSLEEDGTFPRVIYKTWDIGRTVFQCPPCLWKMWDIGSTNFQCPPVFKKRGTLKISTPNVPLFFCKKEGTLQNSTPNVPCFMK